MSSLFDKMAKMLGKLPKSDTIPDPWLWPDFDKTFSDIDSRINSALSNQPGTGLGGPGTTTGRISGTNSNSSNLPQGIPGNPGPLLPGSGSTSSGQWSTTTFPIEEPHASPTNIRQDLSCLSAIFKRFQKQILEKSPLLEKLMKAQGAILVFDPERELLEIRDSKGRVYASKPLNEVRLVDIKE